MHVAQVVRSYRDLPFILYHFQTKERDEPRPRAGVLRTREFIMKDAYTFDRDEEGLDKQYEPHRRLRPDLRPHRARVVPGGVRRRDDGRHGAHEYMAPCAAGENEVALAPGLRGQHGDRQRHAAARRPAGAARRAGAGGHARRHDDRGGRRASSASRPAALIKAFPVVGGRGPAARGRPRRPPRERDQAPERPRRRVPARPPRRRSPSGAAGRLHRPGRSDVACCSTRPSRPGGVRGGRERARHPPARRGARPRLRVRPRRRAHGRGRRPGRTGRRSGSSPRSRSATSSSSARATPCRSARPTSTRPGAEQPIWMGSYGIGPARIVAAAVEQFADERGSRGRARSRRSTSSWSPSARRAATSAGSPTGSTRSCARTGCEVLYDDRDAWPGEKFADAELLGCPLRLTVGRRWLEAGEVEAQVRRGARSDGGAADGGGGGGRGAVAPSLA